MKIEAILFDLDGTLIDSAPGVAWSLNEALKRAGRAELDIGTVKDYVGKGAQHLVTEALKHTGGLESEEQARFVAEDFLATYRDNPTADTVVFPGVIDALEMLRTMGLRMAICTNKPQVTTVPVLEAFALDGYFDVVLSGDRAKFQKPDGRHILETLELLDAGPGGAIMVGDSENDILAAHDAGVPAICVSFGYCHQPFEELEPVFLIDSFDDFDTALKTISHARAFLGSFEAL